MTRTFEDHDSQIALLRFALGDAMGLTQRALAERLGTYEQKLRAATLLGKPIGVVADTLGRLQELMQNEFDLAVAFDDLFALTKASSTATPLPVLSRVKASLLGWAAQREREKADQATTQEEDRDNATDPERAHPGPRTRRAEELGARFD